MTRTSKLHVDSAAPMRHDLIVRGKGQTTIKPMFFESRAAVNHVVSINDYRSASTSRNIYPYRIDTPVDFEIKVLRIGPYLLDSHINFIVRFEDNEYVAKYTDIPELYGCGDSAEDAICMLKEEIISLHEDLEEDENFTEDWIVVKKLLNRLFVK